MFLHDLWTMKADGTERRKVADWVGCETWSPDGKYIAFSYGPKAQEMVGGAAPGWNICVADMSGKWVQVTTDGHHNKEPDWVPIPKPGR